MVRCPRGCSRELIDEADLYRHLRDHHKVTDIEARRLSNLTSGWFEGKQRNSEGEDKAPEHVIAATKAAVSQMTPLKVPIIPMDRPAEATVAPGWSRTETGFTFEKTVREEHKIDNYLKYILKGEIKGNHASLVMWVYDKDISLLSELQEKEALLSAELHKYTYLDPEWLTVGGELHDTSFQIRELKKELLPKVFNEIKLEDTYYDTGFEEGRFEKWQSDFMTRANTAVTEVERELNEKDPIRLK